MFYVQPYPNNLDMNHRDYLKDVSIKARSKPAMTSAMWVKSRNYI